MNIFNYFKKTKASYIIDTDLIETPNVPKGVYTDVQEYKSFRRVGCPAVTSADKRLFFVNSPLTIEVEFGLDNDNVPYYKYIYDSKTTQTTEYTQEWLDKILSVQITNNVVDFQMISPYAFVTDDKDLEIQTLPPPNLIHENCCYVTGAMKPYGWIRNLNSAWAIIDNHKPARLKFNIDKPAIMFNFSKPTEINLIEKTPTIDNYLKQNKFISTYRLHQKLIIQNILKRRPKNLL